MTKTIVFEKDKGKEKGIETKKRGFLFFAYPPFEVVGITLVVE